MITRHFPVVVKRLILAIGIVVGLSTIGVNVGALVAVIGGGTFILGFALQDTLANFANGVMLMVYRPFDVGDAVEVGGISGSVDSVSLVNTHIRSWDNKIIIVPNKSVWGQVITNISGADRRRIDMNFGIGYGDDSEKAQSIPLSTATLMLMLLNPFLVIIYLVDVVDKLSLRRFAITLSRSAFIAGVVFCFFAIMGERVFTRIVQAEFGSFQIFGGVIFLLIGLQ